MVGAERESTCRTCLAVRAARLATASEITALAEASTATAPDTTSGMVFMRALSMLHWRGRRALLSQDVVHTTTCSTASATCTAKFPKS